MNNNVQNANQAEPLRLPLTDIPSEEQMICSLCDYPELYFTVDDILSPGCFSVPLNQVIYTTLEEMILKKEFISMPSVGMKLIKTVGGSAMPVFMEMMNRVRKTSVLRDMATHLFTLKVRREMKEAGEYLSDNIQITNSDPDMVIEETQRRIKEAYTLSDSSLTTGKAMYERLQEHIIVNQDRDPNSVYGTPTGYEEIDKAGGLCPGDLTVIGAETSQGKTSFATSLVVSAIKNGHGVAFYSMEMSDLQITARIASMCSGISSSKMLVGSVPMNDLHYMDSSVADLDLDLLKFDSTSKSSLDSIVRSIRRLVTTEHIKGAVIDYLQLVGVNDSRINREQATAQCAREFKNIAKELGIWIILISQMSRNQTASGAPSMARLRDSGQIEEAADNVWLIYRPLKGESFPNPYQNVSTQGTAMVSIAKGRNTGIGSFICGFKAENTLFYPLKRLPMSADTTAIQDQDAFHRQF